MKNHYEIKDDTIVIYCNAEKGKDPIPFLIDASDFEIANSISGTWYAKPNQKCNSYYAYGRNKGKKEILHRLIMSCPPDKIIDHINRNTRDNRRQNLRVCDATVNQLNKGIQRNNTTGVPGVTLKEGNYVVRVGYKKDRIQLGTYSSLEEAKYLVEKCRQNLIKDPSYWKVIKRYKRLRKKFYSYRHLNKQ